MNITTAATLFKTIADTMEKHNIPWTNVIRFASDIANVMVGWRNSVISRVIQKHSMGCMCHLAALCAAAALKNLEFL